MPELFDVWLCLESGFTASGQKEYLTQIGRRSPLPNARLYSCFGNRAALLMAASRLQTRLISWSAALAIFILRRTCRIRIHNDPRNALKKRGIRYVYSILHAHQVASTIGAERGTGAMVSRSMDGQIIVPALRAAGCVPVRGSGGGRETGGRETGSKGAKGGGVALHALIRHVQNGRPAILAVDGPKGPRNYVQKGIAYLAIESQAVVLNVITVPSRRWILRKTWDRLQIPKPFSTIDAYFAEPLAPMPNESTEDFRARVEGSLNALETQYDPEQASAAAQRSQAA